MNYFSGQIIVAVSNSDAEGVFWSQMLVLAILASVVGLYSVVKIRAKRTGNKEEDFGGGVGRGYNQAHVQNKAVNQVKGMQRSTFPKAGRAKDLRSGMEMLEMVFLLRIIEKTEGDDKDDVMMRKLSFNELLRRGQLKAADSNALKVYAKNEGNLYGKDIQCEAMKELAERTGARGG